MSSMHSTPQIIESNTPHTSTPPDSRPQYELKQLIAKEFRNQAYQFEPDIVARMLSPKRFRNSAIPSSKPSLDDFECLIDHPVVQSAIQRFSNVELKKLGKEDQKTYNSIAGFLNNCIEQCNNVYEEIQNKLPSDSHFKVNGRDYHWFPAQLHFLKYDKETGDSILGESHDRPDLIAFDSANMENLTPDKITAWWGFPRPGPAEDLDKTKHVQILIPVEVKDTWPLIVKHAATYGRSQFNVSPLRAFVVVIAVNHKTGQLRFLIFHHGGLSASRALSLDNPNDSVSIQKILLSMLLWQSAEDAGLPPFANAQCFHLPKPFNGKSMIRSLLYHSLSIRGRNTYVTRIETSPSEEPQTEVLKNETSHSPPQQIQTPQLPDTTGYPLRLTAQRLDHQSSSSSQSSNKGIKRGLSTSKLTKTAAAKPIFPREKTYSLNVAQLGPADTYYITKNTQSLPPNVVIKCSWPTVERERMEPDMYKACDGQFGAPEVIMSFRACFRQNHPMCNSIFLPRNPQDHYWKIFEGNLTAPDTAEYRTLWINVLANEGQNLDECDDASDLSQCLLHCMLGWLSAYQSGYLHRDISIGNLLKLKQSMKPRRPFNVWAAVKLLYPPLPGEERKQEPKMMDRATAFRLANNHPKRLKLVKIVDELDGMVQQVGPLTECKAIFTDGDLAAYIPEYFNKDTKHDKGAISGTREFMSARLLRAIENGTPILQSPLDDLWSFFWTALWATLFNSKRPSSNSNSTEENWRKQLRGVERDLVANAIREELASIKTNDLYSPILRDMAPFLSRWHQSLSNLSPQVIEELIEEKENGAEADYSMLFHKTAYTGVLEFVRALLQSKLLNSTKS